METTKKFSKKALTEKMSSLRFLRIKLTDRCNMRCKMCGQWRLKEISKNQIVHKSYELALNQWKDFIGSLPYNRDLIVYLWGGEPFLFKGVIELIRTIKKKGYRCAITTNGYFLEEHAEAIVRLGLDYLEVSVDGNPELHDRIRGIYGSFKKIEKGLRLVRQTKMSYESLTPLIIMSSTISAYNASYINSIFRSAQRLKVELLILQPIIYTPTKYGLKHQRLMKNIFNLRADSWKGFEVNSPFQITPYLEKNIHSLTQKNWNYFISCSSALYPGRVSDYFNQYENNFGLLCQSPWHTVGILPNGKVTFCDIFPDYILGDIKKENLNKIWNNKRARQFRKFLLENGGLPICNRCCGLFREF